MVVGFFDEFIRFGEFVRVNKIKNKLFEVVYGFYFFVMDFILEEIEVYVVILCFCLRVEGVVDVGLSIYGRFLEVGE